MDETLWDSGFSPAGTRPGQRGMPCVRIPCSAQALSRQTIALEMALNDSDSDEGRTPALGTRA